MKKVCKNCDREQDEQEFFVNRKTGRLEDVCKSCKRDLKTSGRSRRKELSEDAHRKEQLEG